jgi:hypothetical protein
MVRNGQPLRRSVIPFRRARPGTVRAALSVEVRGKTAMSTGACAWAAKLRYRLLGVLGYSVRRKRLLQARIPAQLRVG